jgi:cation:H+ antiporter
MTVLGLTAGFQRWEPALMLFVFGLYSMWTVMAALGQRKPPPKAALADPMRAPGPMSWIMIGACFIGGLVLLACGGSLASDGATGAALALGVPAAIVGVTIVSIGTTLPEMATGVLAVRKGQTDLAVGNAIGSCLFNAGAIFGIAGLLAPPPVDGTMTLPLAFMGALALALIAICRTAGATVSRIEGGLLAGAYVAFLAASAWIV